MPQPHARHYPCITAGCTREAPPEHAHCDACRNSLIRRLFTRVDPAAEAVRLRRVGHARGQAIVEFALLFPLMMLMLAAMLDGGRLAVAKVDQDRRTAVLADWAAFHPADPTFATVAAVMLPGCGVTLDESDPTLVHVASTCAFEPLALHGLWAGLPVSSSADAAVAP